MQQKQNLPPEAAAAAAAAALPAAAAVAASTVEDPAEAAAAADEEAPASQAVNEVAKHSCIMRRPLNGFQCAEQVRCSMPTLQLTATHVKQTACASRSHVYTN